jgi:hypothetical protein
MALKGAYYEQVIRQQTGIVESKKLKQITEIQPNLNGKTGKFEVDETDEYAEKENIYDGIF